MTEGIQQNVLQLLKRITIRIQEPAEKNNTIWSSYWRRMIKDEHAESTDIRTDIRDNKHRQLPKARNFAKWCCTARGDSEDQWHVCVCVLEGVWLHPSSSVSVQDSVTVSSSDPVFSSLQWSWSCLVKFFISAVRSDVGCFDCHQQSSHLLVLFWVLVFEQIIQCSL